jgi:hypothetical protein
MEPFIFNLLRENPDDLFDGVIAIDPGQKRPDFLAGDATHTSFSWECAMPCRLRQALQRQPG